MTAKATAHSVAGPGPFSRPIEVDRLPDAGLEISISASAPERAAVAALDDLLGISELGADFRLARRGRDGVAVSGALRARIAQRCVVSLEPFESDIVEEIAVEFVPEAESAAAHARALAQIEAAPDRAGALFSQSDPPDPIVDGRIDLGALVCEFLALALDPHPKRPGVEFQDRIVEDSRSDASPFAVLRKFTEGS